MRKLLSIFILANIITVYLSVASSQEAKQQFKILSRSINELQRKRDELELERIELLILSTEDITSYTFKFAAIDVDNTFSAFHRSSYYQEMLIELKQKIIDRQIEYIDKKINIAQTKLDELRKKSSDEHG